MRKRFVRILVAAALLSVTVAGIGTAHAYFTTYVEAMGRKTVRMGDTTRIREEIDGKKKIVAVTNDSKSVKPVWVRAKAIVASKYASGLSYTPGTGWADVNPDGEKDGWWYYVIPENTPLAPGETTAELVAEIKEWPKAEIDKDFNVVVVYETTPAVEDGTKTDETGKEITDKDGNPVIQYVPPTMADWNRTVEVK